MNLVLHKVLDNPDSSLVEIYHFVNADEVEMSKQHIARVLSELVARGHVAELPVRTYWVATSKGKRAIRDRAIIASLSAESAAEAVTPETLTDDMICEHLAWLRAGERAPGDGPREACRDCVAALSTDSTRRYVHELREEFEQRKQKHHDARRRVCDAINARRSA